MIENDRKYKYIFRFPKQNPACFELTYRMVGAGAAVGIVIEFIGHSKPNTYMGGYISYLWPGCWQVKQLLQNYLVNISTVPEV